MVRKKKSRINEEGIAAAFGIGPQKAKKEKPLTLKQIGGTLKARKIKTAEKILANPMSSGIEKIKARRTLENGT